MADTDSPHNLAELPFRGDGDIARIKMQPHSIEAEQSVLGGLLLSADAWDAVSEAEAKRITDAFEQQRQKFHNASHRGRTLSSRASRG